MKNKLLPILILLTLIFSGCMANLPGKVVSDTAPSSVDADAATVPEPEIANAVIPNDANGANDPLPDMSQPIPAGTTFTDPWQYCAAVNTIDQPGPEYVGEKPPSALRKTALSMLSVPESDAGGHNIFWRCMDREVYACDSTLTAHCFTRMTMSTTPIQPMIDACRDPNLEGQVLPSAVTGAETPYEWSCIEGAPTITGQGITVDSQGLNAYLWVSVPNIPIQ